MGFRNRVRGVLARLDYDPHDMSEQISALRADTASTAAAATTPPEKLQVSALSALIRASSDMHRLDTIACDNPTAEISTPALLENAKIRIALVNRRRTDIAAPGHTGALLSRKTLKWEKTKLTQTLAINDRAQGPHRVDIAQWREDILRPIRLAGEQGTNIVCFGEFDYPIFPDTAAEDKFEKEVFAVIDGCEAEMVIFAGSKHVCDRETSSYRNEEITEFAAHNVGYVFFNDATLRGMWKPNGGRLQKVYKRTPAVKVGEQLSRRDDITLSAFSTVLGRLAFLICSDAYDPTVLMEIFAKSTDESVKPEIIFVPSYNTSSKLGLMCQVLSLMTDSIVVLLDACAESSDTDDKPIAELWNCGMPASIENGIVLVGTSDLDRGEGVQTWEVDWNVVKEYRLACTASASMPLFDEARKIAQIRKTNLN